MRAHTTPPPSPDNPVTRAANELHQLARCLEPETAVTACRYCGRLARYRARLATGQTISICDGTSCGLMVAQPQYASGAPGDDGEQRAHGAREAEGPPRWHTGRVTAFESQTGRGELLVDGHRHGFTVADLRGEWGEPRTGELVFVDIAPTGEVRGVVRML